MRFYRELAQTVYIRSIFVPFCAKISKYTGLYTILANPTNMSNLSSRGVGAHRQLHLRGHKWCAFNPSHTIKQWIINEHLMIHASTSHLGSRGVDAHRQLHQRRRGTALM